MCTAIIFYFVMGSLLSGHVATARPAASLRGLAGLAPKPCTPGTFSATGFGPKCFDCPSGSVSGTQATVCSPCPEGSFAGRLASSVCTYVPVLPSSLHVRIMTKHIDSCSLCPAGKYAPTPGRSTCIPASKRHFACGPGPQCKGATSETICSAGTFAGRKGQSACAGW